MNTNAFLRKRLHSALVGSILALGLAFTTNLWGYDRELDDQDDVGSVLYVETNDFNLDSNAVLAYRINPFDGGLTLLGIFPTRGTGQDNFDVRLGPDDHDNEIVLSPNKKFLFAVNAGSNTIAVFKVHRSGRLTHVEGSPFPSEGVTPVSLGLAGDKLVVLNANNNNGKDTKPNNALANYTTFRVSKNGSLAHIPGSVEVAGDSNPVQVAMAPNGRVVFGMDLFAVPYAGPQIFPFLPARGSVLEAFHFSKNGSLQRSPGTPFLAPPNSRLITSDPGTGYFLGLLAHPRRPILYAGEAITNRLAVYTYDDAGTLNFVTDSPSLGLATCWIAMGKGARFLYTSDAASNQVGVWSLNDPLSPVNIQELSLKLVGTPPAPVPPAEFATVNFQLSVDPSGRFLYVTNHAAAQTDYPGGNVIHVLQIQPDGTMVEPWFSPVLLPVPGNVHPTGNAIR
ncbi:MAG: beta-propeller fold lactonase family protein [Acidobacteriia bacterium]|nr:beta-propeller fold lactonase family protein [Terriglobia bacterium]